MADKGETRDTGHAVFGLNQPSTRTSGAAPAAAPSISAAPAPTPSGQPQYVYVQTAPPSTGSASKVTIVVLVIVLVILAGVNLYLALSTRSAFKETLAKHTDQLDLLTRRLDSSDERYARLSATFQVTTKRLGLTQQELANAKTLAADIQKQQQAAVQQLNTAISQKASAEEVNKLQADTNTKVGVLSGDIAGTKKDLEDTKAALTGTKGELTGAIARTHDELVALAHRTDRDYYEFKLSRKGAKQKIGTMTIELQKTNPKKNQYTVNLYVDDKRTERRDKSINEPVAFLAQGAPSPLELVVNKLDKEAIAGYISAPKGFLGSVPNVLASRPGT